MLHAIAEGSLLILILSGLIQGADVLLNVAGKAIPDGLKEFVVKATGIAAITTVVASILGALV